MPLDVMKFFKKITPILRALFWIWLCSILILMIIPTSGVSLNDFPGRDKLLHLGVFGLLGFLYTFTRVNSVGLFHIGRRNWSTYLLIFFSLAVEFVQLILIYRTFELLDIFMNGLGLVCGIILGKALLSRTVSR